MPVILAIQEAEMRRITVRSQPRQIQTQSGEKKKTIQNKTNTKTRLVE
jgi:hypothetical protein